jgi:hypothetical protein
MLLTAIGTHGIQFATGLLRPRRNPKWVEISSEAHERADKLRLDAVFLGLVRADVLRAATSYLTKIQRLTLAESRLMKFPRIVPALRFAAVGADLK